MDTFSRHRAVDAHQGITTRQMRRNLVLSRQRESRTNGVLFARATTVPALLLAFVLPSSPPLLLLLPWPSSSSSDMIDEAQKVRIQKIVKVCVLCVRAAIVFGVQRVTRKEYSFSCLSGAPPLPVEDFPKRFGSAPQLGGRQRLVALRCSISNTVNWRNRRLIFIVDCRNWVFAHFDKAGRLDRVHRSRPSKETQALLRAFSETRSSTDRIGEDDKWKKGV